MTYTPFLKNFLAGAPLGAGLSSRGRMRRDGPNLIKDGKPFVMRGFNWGHGPWLPGDGAVDASLGANNVRIIARSWGFYNPPEAEGLQLGTMGNWNPAYLARLKLRILDAKQAGLTVTLARDSQCGQNGNQDSTQTAYCTLNGHPGQNFYTPDGQVMRAAYTASNKTLARVFRGLVDIFEPAVEQNPADGYPGVYTQDDINQLYKEQMVAWLEEDPYMIFALGGVSYNHSHIQNCVQGISYPTDQIVLTCNYLDSIMSSSSTTFEDAVGDATVARKKTGFPVYSDQAGIQYSSELSPIPGNLHDSDRLRENLEILRLAPGGSIGIEIWERVGSNPVDSLGGYGPWADPSLDGSGRGVKSQNRINVCSAAFRATPIPATGN